jgi:hypothetical protein
MCHGSALEREVLVHGYARLKLVGTPPIDGIEECPKDEYPKSLPFPTCVQTLLALDNACFSLAKLRAALDETCAHDDGPRAA